MIEKAPIPAKKEEYSPEERKILGAYRGGEVSRAFKTEELEKSESGQYIASEEYIEKARKAMEEAKPNAITEEKLEELKRAKEEARINLEALGGGGGVVQRQVFEERAKKTKEEYEQTLNIIHPEMTMPEMPGAETLETEEKPEKSKWGWIKERLKGVATLGFWEFHQAEKFRSATKKIGKELGASQKGIEATENLTYEEARAEAEKMEQMMKAVEIVKGRKSEATAEEYERMSKAITGEKLSKNNSLIEEILKKAETTLSEKLAKYKNEFGKEVLNEKSKTKLLENIKKALYERQLGQVEKDSKELTKLVRDNLDPKYWRRYIYGGVELALDAVLIKLILGGVAAETAGVKTIALDKTIWHTTSEFLAQHGITNPSNAQILEASKIVAEQNGVAVKVWGISGQMIDTALPKGLLLDYGGVLEKLAYIKGL